MAEEALALTDDVVAQPVEQAREGNYIVGGEAGAELPVEGDGRGAQAVEEGLARVGQLDDVDAAVRGVAVAGEQAVSLHGVEVVGQGCALDTDSLGQLALVGQRVGLERDEDEPDRQRSAGNGERVVEGAAGEPGGTREMEADRRPTRWRHAPRIAPTRLII